MPMDRPTTSITRSLNAITIGLSPTGGQAGTFYGGGFKEVAPLRLGNERGLSVGKRASRMRQCKRQPLQEEIHGMARPKAQDSTQGDSWGFERLVFIGFNGLMLIW